MLAVGDAPASVSIPSIGIDEPLIDLGIAADGTMEVPDAWDAVGWFTGGGRPGGIGPTVIAGHVDSPTGPAVFIRLTELEVGDTVQVTDVAGTVFDYEVYRVGDYAKKDFPTAEVFGAPHRRSAAHHLHRPVRQLHRPLRGQPGGVRPSGVTPPRYSDAPKVCTFRERVRFMTHSRGNCAFSTGTGTGTGTGDGAGAGAGTGTGRRCARSTRC